MSIEEIAARLRPTVESAGFTQSAKFDTGEGVIVIDGSTVSTEDAPADCTIIISKEDLEALLAGELSPTEAFMSGKIKVDGDMSVAMALSQFVG